MTGAELIEKFNSAYDTAIRFGHTEDEATELAMLRVYNLGWFDGNDERKEN